MYVYCICNNILYILYTIYKYIVTGSRESLYPLNALSNTIR